jgi:hypothetical protein
VQKTRGDPALVQMAQGANEWPGILRNTGGGSSRIPAINGRNRGRADQPGHPPYRHLILVCPVRAFLLENTAFAGVYRKPFWMFGKENPATGLKIF